VPVRVELDAKQLAAHPLRVGLSMEATVDVGLATGAPVTSTPAARTSSSTPVFRVQDEAADKRVREIIAANLGQAVRHAAAASTSRMALARSAAR
jgi:membrane fusion protein, multidrug efflux system